MAVFQYFSVKTPNIIFCTNVNLILFRRLIYYILFDVLPNLLKFFVYIKRCCLQNYNKEHLPICCPDNASELRLVEGGRGAAIGQSKSRDREVDTHNCWRNLL